MKLDDYGDVLTPKELLEILPIGRNTLYKRLKSGEIKSKRCGTLYLVTMEDLKKYLNLDSPELHQIPPLRKDTEYGSIFSRKVCLQGDTLW